MINLGAGKLYVVTPDGEEIFIGNTLSQKRERPKKEKPMFLRRWRKLRVPKKRKARTKIEKMPIDRSVTISFKTDITHEQAMSAFYGIELKNPRPIVMMSAT